MKFTSSCFLCCTTAMAAWPCPDPSQGPVICHLLEGQGGGGQIGKLSPDRKWTHCLSLHPGPWVTPRVGMLSLAVEFKFWDGWLCVCVCVGGGGGERWACAYVCLGLSVYPWFWELVTERGWMTVYNWVWPCASVPCTRIHTCEGVHQCACPSDPMCLCLRVESTMPCRFFCLWWAPLPPSSGKSSTPKQWGREPNPLLFGMWFLPRHVFLLWQDLLSRPRSKCLAVIAYCPRLHSSWAHSLEWCVVTLGDLKICRGPQ